MPKNKPQFLITAPTSGSGKTTIAQGLMKLLTDKGLKVQPYKCGPDYIDTKFHNAACGRPSINLDLFMATEKHVKDIYSHYAVDSDVCITEGMMGMFDGFDRWYGSSADIAKVLNLPIVIVVNASSAAYSMAPLLKGFMSFWNELNVAGVIFNKVGSTQHAQKLKEVCDDINIECFGYIYKDAKLEHHSRYLGLDFSEATNCDSLLKAIDTNINWKRILEKTSVPVAENGYTPNSTHINGTISVAKNADAFSFIYQEHIDILRNMGEVVFFDPEEDKPIPEHTSLLYLPGGYPEKHLGALASVTSTLKSIRHYANSGGKILAECGGMMYLCKSIINDSMEAFMTGVIPYSISARATDKKLTLGYRQMILGSNKVKGHEFHYTQFDGQTPLSAIQVYDSCGNATNTTVFRKGNILASYTHLYWGEHDITKFFGK